MIGQDVAPHSVLSFEVYGDGSVNLREAGPNPFAGRATTSSDASKKAVSAFVGEITGMKMCREGHCQVEGAEFTDEHAVAMSDVGGIHLAVANRSGIEHKSGDEPVLFAEFLGNRRALVANCALVGLRVAALQAEGSCYAAFYSDAKKHAIAYAKTACPVDPEADDSRVFCGSNWLSEHACAQIFDFMVGCIAKCPVMPATQMHHDAAVGRGERQALAINELSAGLCTAGSTSPTWNCGLCQHPESFRHVACNQPGCGGKKKWSQWNLGDTVTVSESAQRGVVAGTSVDEVQVLVHCRLRVCAHSWSDICPDSSMYPDV